MYLIPSKSILYYPDLTFNQYQLKLSYTELIYEIMFFQKKIKKKHCHV